ncbi:alpha/beta hydrolase-fold protein [Legionella sp. CNM-4043-24]|uniref:alpha/beta hydrolase-fold protein n=1 Tax=Legionella sp. CNM-4043-24 TaxID=3421646 RepID=UPI00403A9EA8
MTIAQEFIKKLQDATGREPLPEKFWADFSSHTGMPAFQDVLDKYAEYYRGLSPPQKEEMDKIFWGQVKALGGTPIIEDGLNTELECEVYFLFPKKNLAGSTEVPGNQTEVPRTHKEYELALMSTLPDNNTANAENGIIYLSEEGNYVVRDPGGVVQEGTLDTSERDLSQLQMSLKNSDLKSAILKVTSNAGHTPKKNLYLQGDFHGYGSTDGRQELSEHLDTGIMCLRNTMPRDSLVVYSYIEVEPRHRGKKPEPELPPFFEVGDGFTPRTTNPAIFPEIPHSGCNDEFSSHASPYFFNSSEKIVRINPDPERAHIAGKPIDWPGLLNTETSGTTKHFVYHDALYSDKEGELHRSDAPVTAQYHDRLFYSDTEDDSPYADFTRAIQVFKPASGQIDNIIVINDGIPSLMTGCMEHFEKMLAEEKLSPNTAFVFINPLPGLKTTLSKEARKAFDNDPSVNLPGMGARLIDYRHGIDQYIDFIAAKLFPELEKEQDWPSEPHHRVMRGVSLSGTASIYIGSKRPDLFDGVIAQSPSSANRAILSEIPREKLTGRNLYLSCGKFEHPSYAAANAFVEYADEIAEKLGITLHKGEFGHQNIAWNEELEKSLPATLELASLASAREINQQFKGVLEEMRTSAAASSYLEGDVVTPSPFQVTPKP